MMTTHFREGDYKGAYDWIERVGIRDKDGGYMVPDHLELSGVLAYVICEQWDRGATLPMYGPARRGFRSGSML